MVVLPEAVNPYRPTILTAEEDDNGAGLRVDNGAWLSDSGMTISDG
jgi:hypothetical protein